MSRFHLFEEENPSDLHSTIPSVTNVENASTVSPVTDVKSLSQNFFRNATKADYFSGREQPGNRVFDGKSYFTAFGI